MNRPVTGRFAPSPTGPLHLGSLVAAVGSWLFARSANGRWLVRMEDLDSPRVVRGAADEILQALERYGLTWDGEVEYQSRRLERYEEALAQLRNEGRVFDCACSRADLQCAASAPLGSEPGYPGTCRNGIESGRVARATRFRVPQEPIAFRDLIHGDVVEDLNLTSGDFVVKRADGVFAYQLSVTVDDAAQGITEVVRGGDLLDSTARQIALYNAFRLPVPRFAHLPVVLAADGSKLGKRDGALPLPTLDPRRVSETLNAALQHLGIETAPATPQEMLQESLTKFGVEKIPRENGTQSASS